MHVCMATCMYVCVHACMHVYMHVFMYVCLPVMYACIYVCMCACMYVCVHACMHVYMHVCMCKCICVCMHACMNVCVVHACVYVCMHVCMCACMYACVHDSMYVCMNVCMCVCMYACVHGCTHGHTRSRYFKKVRNNIEEHEHLKFAFDLISSCNSPANKIISDSLRDVNWKSEALVKLMESIGVKTDSSKRSVYLQMNPSLETPTLYTKVYIPEFKRLSYTRIRLPAHNLRIELGQWCRTPRDERLCVCREDVQSEEHVLLHCHLTEHLREKFEITSSNLTQMFKGNESTLVILYMKFC